MGECLTCIMERLKAESSFKSRNRSTTASHNLDART